MLQKHNLRPSSICEIGCGAGEILNQLHAHLGGVVPCTGYEISPQAFALCRGKQKANLEFISGDLLADPAAHFEMALAIDVFEHVEDYFGFLRRFREKARYKLFHIPLDLSVQTVLRASPLVDLRRSVGHLHSFTKESALAALHDTGYHVIDHVYTTGSLDLDDRGWKANLLRLPRRVLFSINQDLTVRILGGFSLLVLAE